MKIIKKLKHDIEQAIVLIDPQINLKIIEDDIKSQGEAVFNTILTESALEEVKEYGEEEWRLLKDVKPNVGQTCIVTYDGGNVGTEVYFNDGFIPHFIKAWRPMPKPYEPEGETAE